MTERDKYIKTIKELRGMKLFVSHVFCTMQWFVEYQIAINIHRRAENLEAVAAALEGVRVVHVDGLDHTTLMVEGRLMLLDDAYRAVTAPRRTAEQLAEWKSAVRRIGGGDHERLPEPGK